MQFGDFKLVCFTQGINPQLIDACEKFVLEHDYMLDPTKKTAQNRNSKNDLGYAELQDITTIAEGFFAMKDCIYMQTCDYDKNGRSLEKMRMKQMIKNPSKSFKRIVLKTFYLSNGVI